MALVFRAHLHKFLADSFSYAILRAIHICATVGRHCQFFSAHFLRSKCYSYPQEHIIIIIYLTASELTPGGSSTATIYTQTVHRIQRTKHT